MRERNPGRLFAETSWILPIAVTYRSKRLQENLEVPAIDLSADEFAMVADTARLIEIQGSRRINERRMSDRADRA